MRFEVLRTMRYFTSAVLVLLIGFTSRGFAQATPFPPLLNGDSLKIVSAEERLVEIRARLPRKDSQQNPIPAGSHLSLRLYVSRDEGRTYEDQLSISGNSHVVFPPRGVVEAVVRTTIPREDWEKGGVFLAISTTLNEIESKRSHSFLSFSTGESLTVYRRPVELRRTLRPNEPATTESHYVYSAQQESLVDKFGEPDLFEIAFLIKDEDGQQSRLERWFYLEPRAAVTFSDGQLANYEEFEGMPAVRTKPLYKPSQIGPELDPSAIERMVSARKTWQLDTEKLGFESRLYQNVSLHLGKGLITGYKGDSLLYVRSLPNWAQSQDGSLQRTSKDSDGEFEQASMQPLKPSLPAKSCLLTENLLLRESAALRALSFRQLALTGAGLTEALSMTSSTRPSILHVTAEADGWVSESNLAPIDPFSTGASIFVIGSMAYGLYGLGGDLNKIGDAGEMTVRLYTSMNTAMDETETYFNQRRQAGSLSKAEHQRLQELSTQVRRDLEAAQMDLVKHQAALTGEAMAFGLISVATLEGGLTKITNFVRGSQLPVAQGLRNLASNLGKDASTTKGFLITTFADGASYASGERPWLLDQSYINGVMNWCETRASSYDRSRYHQSQIRQQVIAAWNRWDHEISDGNMTNADRTQAFHELIDQLQQDGWHVADGVEDYSIGVVRSLTGVTPSDVPPERDPSELRIEAIIAKGSPTNEWKTHFRTLMVRMINSIKIFGDEPNVAKFDIRTEPIELVISKDRIATVESATINFEVAMDDGQNSKSYAVLSFDKASGEAIEISDSKNDDGEFYVKRVRGTGKVNINGQSMHACKWSARHQGFGHWELIATMALPEDAQALVGAKSLSVVFELVQPE